MPCKPRSSERLLHLVCDGVVWLHLLKQTTEFSKETLEGLVDFVPKNRRLVLMPEVLRFAARRLSSLVASPGQSPARITWTL